MRILHLTKKYSDVLGGDAVVVDQLRQIQVEHGHSVNVLTSHCAGIRDDPWVTKFGLSTTPTELDGLGTRRVISVVALAAQAFGILRRLKPDIIHSHAVDLGFAIGAAARSLRIPVVQTCHGSIIGTDFLTPSKRILESRLLRHGGFAAITALSEGVSQRLADAACSRIEVIPNGVQAERLAASHEGYGSRQFLAVGRLEHQKGFDILIPAFAPVVAAYPDARLRIVGDGSQRDRLRALITESGMSDVVEIGALPPPILTELYRRADALVLSSRWEGLPLTLLEGWASGCAMVATRTGSIPEVVQDGHDCLLVDPEDAGGLSAAMSKLASTPVLCEVLGGNGRERVVESYTWDRIAAQYEALYRFVTKSPGL